MSKLTHASETGRAQKAGLGYMVQKKIGDKRIAEQEEKVAAWIATVSGQNKPAGTDYEDWLKNGVVLCHLLNAINPGSVKKVNTTGHVAFKFMANIEEFTAALKKMGVPTEETFQTVDLWEKMNIPAVTNCIYSLARQLQKDPNFKGPELAPKESEAQKRDFTDEQLKAGQTTIGLQMGSNQGASQAGMSMGKQRMVLD